MENKKIILGVIVCVAVSIVSFLGGVSYGKTKSNVNSFSNRQGYFNQGGFNGQQNREGKMMGQGIRNGMGGGFVSGDIISKDDKSITLKLRDGGSKVVLFSPSSKVEKTVDGVVSDIMVGKSVMVTGTANPDGSVSATSIQIRPAIPIVAPANTTN